MSSWVDAVKRLLGRSDPHADDGSHTHEAVEQRLSNAERRVLVLEARARAQRGGKR